jgi:hypothetical protein
MPHYQLFNPDTEMLGEVIIALEKALGTDRYTDLFARHGLKNVVAGKWYPAQKWVDILNEIAASPTNMADFVSVGVAQIEKAAFPTEFNDMPIAEILRHLDDAYQMNYRGSEIGGVRAEKVGDKHVQILIRSFEPDDLWYGNLHGLMRRFLPKGKGYKVFYDREAPRREQGSYATIIHVTWE